MLIVATAGHVDHGKTTLVYALTGIDTDRLPEERQRGMSIDLGFAYWQTDPDLLVAFIDVPGHQRFIRNMLAGVAAIHCALVVVAVDDGLMPQTIEHIRILTLLGVRQGVLVLSKIDVAGPQRIAEVHAEARQLLRGTTLEDIPVLEVSARAGTGVLELRALLARMARTHDSVGNKNVLPRRARFTVDRAFSVKGAGTVVTGTVIDGEIDREDVLVAWHNRGDLRIRGIQVHGREVSRVGSGQRAALNVAGPELSGLSRGTWLAHRSVWRPGGQMLTARLSVLPDAAPLHHSSRAHVHLGASAVSCRVLLPAQRGLEPGESGPARLHLDRALFAVNGDRFVLRDPATNRTLGGGVVVDPCVGKQRSDLSGAEFDMLASGDPEATLRTLLMLHPSAGVELARFERIFNLSERGSHVAIRACNAMLLGKSRPVILRRTAIDAIIDAATAALRRDPCPSVAFAKLHQRIAPALPADVFDSLLRSHAPAAGISLAGGSASLRERDDALHKTDLAIWDKVYPAMAGIGLPPADVARLAARAGVNVGRLRAILNARARRGEVFALQPGKYIVRSLAARLAAAAACAASQSADGSFTAAQYRDTIGTGRAIAILVLEMFDAVGVTRRSGDRRRIWRNPHELFGPAVPFAAQSEVSANVATTATAGRGARTIHFSR